MVIEAVTKLADRHGTSIQAIRKYITNNFPLKQQQTASFNSLTLKALGKAVALDVLEYDKRLYRISASEKDRRKEKERSLKNAASAASRDAFAMVIINSCFVHLNAYIFMYFITLFIYFIYEYYCLLSAMAKEVLVVEAI